MRSLFYFVPGQGRHRFFCNNDVKRTIVLCDNLRGGASLLPAACVFVCVCVFARLSCSLFRHNWQKTQSQTAGTLFLIDFFSPDSLAAWGESRTDAETVPADCEPDAEAALCEQPNWLKWEPTGRGQRLCLLCSHNIKQNFNILQWHLLLPKCYSWGTNVVRGLV